MSGVLSSPEDGAESASSFGYFVQKIVYNEKQDFFCKFTLVIDDFNPVMLIINSHALKTISSRTCYILQEILPGEKCQLYKLNISLG